MRTWGQNSIPSCCRDDASTNGVEEGEAARQKVTRIAGAAHIASGERISSRKNICLPAAQPG